MADEGFFEVMKDAISAIAESSPVQEMKSEFGRLLTQGSAELASALFGESNAYVAYGRGQDPVEQAVEAPEQERGGMEM